MQIGGAAQNKCGWCLCWCLLRPLLSPPSRSSPLPTDSHGCRVVGGISEVIIHSRPDAGIKIEFGPDFATCSNQFCARLGKCDRCSLRERCHGRGEHGPDAPGAEGMHRVLE